MPKYIVLIADGCADLPLAELSGRTPLMASEKPHIDAMARRGVVGRARTVPEGVPAGSDTAILSLFGYDPREYYSGRSPLEAAGVGAPLRSGNLSLRVNLAAVEEADGGRVMRSHSGGNIEGEEATALIEELLADGEIQAELTRLGAGLLTSPTFRQIAVLRSSPGPMETSPPHEIVGEQIGPHMPRGAGQALHRLMERSYELLHRHPVNEARRKRGKLAANMLWPWGEGEAIELPPFVQRTGHSAAVVSAVPLVWGIATLAGLPVVKVEGATADLHTDYEGKADAAAKALLDGADCVFVHVEAPDECSHDGDLEGKLEAIHRIDSRLLPRLTGALTAAGESFRLLLLSDHCTLLSTRGHDGTPVPFLLYDSERDSGRGLPFDEQAAQEGPMVDPATGLLPLLFEQTP